MKGFLGNLTFAEEFFQRCIDQEAVTEADRLKILEALTKELKAVKLNERDLERYFKTKRCVYLRKRDNK